jgi:hypothetical protein
MYSQLNITSRFWPRVRARALRAPILLGLLTWQLTPMAASLLLIHPPKITISRNKLLLFLYLLILLVGAILRLLILLLLYFKLFVVLQCVAFG